MLSAFIVFGLPSIFAIGLGVMLVNALKDKEDGSKGDQGALKSEAISSLDETMLWLNEEALAREIELALRGDTNGKDAILSELQEFRAFCLKKLNVLSTSKTVDALTVKDILNELRGHRDGLKARIASSQRGGFVDKTQSKGR